MNFGNTRSMEQIRRMEALKKAGVCYFCRKGSEEKVTTPHIIYEKEFWYVTPNNFPYEGSEHHYVVVPKRHLKDLVEILPDEAIELFEKIIPWLKKHLKATGYSMFVRSGNMKFTGATIDHLHFHFLVGGPKKKNGILQDNILVTLGHKKKQK